ncbi:MAG: hypothetical protein SVK08_02960, partial [Halobacteriota archaeon]|nr:hypothetical protein [Halobacteriota archaeon]
MRTVEIEMEKETVEYPLRDEDFTIDPSNIDVELCNMGRTMLEYGEIETQLRLEVDRKEAALKKFEADLDARFRSDFAKQGIKATESKIQNTIISNETRNEIVADILKSRRHHNLMRWVMQALQAKRD